MIQWDFEAVTETRTDEDGEEYQTELRGPIRVWFHDSDPEDDEPDQIIDWREQGLHVSTPGTPDAVRDIAAVDELADADDSRAAEIRNDLLTNNIKRVE